MIIDRTDAEYAEQDLHRRLREDPWAECLSRPDILSDAAKIAADTLAEWKASPDMIEEVSARILAFKPAGSR